MRFCRMSAGRGTFVRALVAAAGLARAALTPVLAPGRFRYDQDLLLDDRPIRLLKRRLDFNVGSDGSATTFLWCQTVRGRVQLTDSAIRVRPAPLHDRRPILPPRVWTPT